MFKRLRRRGENQKQRSGSTSVPGSGLQVCSECRADYVYPLEWREADGARWWMLLRCGECSTQREVTVPDDVATRYGKHLDGALREIDREWMRLDRERMAGEAEIFVAALHRDLIDAGDFVS